MKAVIPGNATASVSWTIIFQTASAQSILSMSTPATISGPGRSRWFRCDESIALYERRSKLQLRRRVDTYCHRLLQPPGPVKCCAARLDCFAPSSPVSASALTFWHLEQFVRYVTGSSSHQALLSAAPPTRLFRAAQPCMRLTARSRRVSGHNMTARGYRLKSFSQ